MDLRPYQADLVAAILAAFAAHRSVLVTLPTGGGKTRVASRIAEQSADAGERVWFVAHRREILGQTSATLARLGVPHGVVGPGFDFAPDALVQVCSVGSLARRSDALPAPSLLIWDEAHHVPAASWRALRALHPQARHLGLTATPDRLDGKGLAEHFADLICGPTTAELIAAGHLSRYRLFAPTIPDLRGISISRGDYAKGELGERMGRPALVGDVVEHFRRLAPGARAIAFAVTVEASQAFAARFNTAGIPARHVGATTPGPERDAAIADLAAGRIKVICNVEVFSEGVDAPAVDAVILLRPTRSLSLFLQMVGRGLRPAPGKAATIILDHSGLAYEHGLPDDAIDWTLGGSRTARGPSSEAPLRRCPGCGAMHRWAVACVECGRLYADGDRTLDEVYGEMHELKRPHSRDGFDSLRGFARRAGVSVTAVRNLVKRGLPRASNGLVPVEPALQWLNAHPVRPSSAHAPSSAPIGGSETSAAFAARTGLSRGQVQYSIRRGMPTAPNGWIAIEPALAWLAGRAKGGSSIAEFAERAGANRRHVQYAKGRGLPLEADGSIATEAALRWWAERSLRHPHGFEPKCNFARRVGLGSSAARALVARGLPVATNGLIHIETGLAWIAKHGVRRRKSKKQAPPTFGE